MSESFDKDKLVDCMFDPITGLIMAELESGEKEDTYLAEKSNIAPGDVRTRLEYLIMHDFIYERIFDDRHFFSANHKKLASFIENNNAFDGAIDGLTKIDSYLN